MSKDGLRYAFHAEFYDTQAELIKHYLISYFPEDNTTQIYDMKQRRVFLRRMEIESLSLKDFYLGNCITIYGRKFMLAKYADQFTEMELGGKNQDYTFRISLDSNLGNVLMTLVENNLSIKQLKSFDNGQNQTFVAINVVGTNSRTIVESAFPGQMEFTITGDLNSSAKSPLCAKFVTSAVIKPHAVRENLHATIISEICKEWNITAVKTINFSVEEAREYLEIYNGVVDEFRHLVDEMTASKAIVIEIYKENEENIVSKFRDFLGPRDPLVGQKVAPNSIRAKFGKDLIQNVIHSTDIEQDGLRDCTLLFQQMN